ncbi:hypothetical protein L9F63_005723, partial [Diploptera punctata]
PLTADAGRCITCRQNLDKCRGHFGHIELPIPVNNIVYTERIYQIIRLACLRCHNLQITGGMKLVFITKLKLVNSGLFLECQKVDEIVSEFIRKNTVRDTTLDHLVKKRLDQFYSQCLEESKVTSEVKKSRMIENLTNEVISAVEKYKSDSKKCYFCHKALKKVTMFKNKLMKVKEGEVLTGSSDADKSVLTVFMPNKLRNHLRNIWKNERELVLAFLPVLANCEMEYPTDALFIKVISVPPIKIRPVSVIDDKLVHHGLNGIFRTILENSYKVWIIIRAIHYGKGTLKKYTQLMLEAMKGKSLLENLHIAYSELQDSVNALKDDTQEYHNKKIEGPGLKQIAEATEDRIRQFIKRSEKVGIYEAQRELMPLTQHQLWLHAHCELLRFSL